MDHTEAVAHKQFTDRGKFRRKFLTHCRIFAGLTWIKANVFQADYVAVAQPRRHCSSLGDFRSNWDIDAQQFAEAQGNWSE
jgi:hypothetical protein